MSHYSLLLNIPDNERAIVITLKLDFRDTCVSSEVIKTPPSEWSGKEKVLRDPRG